MHYGCFSNIFSVCTAKKKKKNNFNGQKEQDSEISKITCEDMANVDIINSYSKKKKKSKKNKPDLAKLKKSIETINSNQSIEEDLIESLDKLSTKHCNKKRKHLEKKNKFAKVDKIENKKVKLKKLPKKNESGEVHKNDYHDLKINSTSEIEENLSRQRKKSTKKIKTKKSVKFKNNKIETRTFLSKEDLEKMNSKPMDCESESEICFYNNSAEQLQFNEDLKMKMLAFLSKQNKEK